ncbi:MAG: hypothetical protein ACD_7C00511G0011 [uncultured bacterium]|nr:MAG: hypothetical protein ACD_7C00511G0011 [uncultured bacterium]
MLLVLYMFYDLSTTLFCTCQVKCKSFYLLKMTSTTIIYISSYCTLRFAGVVGAVKSVAPLFSIKASN